ncbi:MAG TPA: NAD(P)(+) transhydrogenase (Re/Si-specific) subunit beta, partial [Solirubrobacteraceae bacterium]|nr:NAD(P)(+) transhydrogenase (Re/Si-specific) subunit beta [Solirubrobacteraceae bacterium]
MSAAPLATTFLQSDSFIYVLYIIAFALFIQGLRGLAGPTTAVRGNRIAGVGMAIAVVATLLSKGEGNWGLIVLGVALGVAVGVPAARQVKMTAMPQMVALFNGVGGGAVALISWVEFRHYGSTYGSKTLEIGHQVPGGPVVGTGLQVHVGGVPTYVAVFSV